MKISDQHSTNKSVQARDLLIYSHIQRNLSLLIGKKTEIENIQEKIKEDSDDNHLRLNKQD